MQTYEDLCEEVLVESAENHRKHKNFCIKLIRNLYSPSNYGKRGNLNSERCKNLTNWLYYMIIKYGVPNDLISKCFEKTRNKMTQPGKHICPYSPYNEIHQEPEAMLEINNFQGIMDIIKTKLIDNDDSKNCSCKEYVYECVKMYNKMNTEYCSTVHNRENKYKITCSQLNLFKNSYDIYYRTNQDLINKIPSLDNPPVQHYFNCSSSNSDKELASVNNEQNSSSTSSTLPTAIGTMAGVSSVLAFLYKVSTNFNLII
ncbi:hypothetical protein PVMG_05355 [Plasmodium vivax Mauritania I]|uniref:PIR Superfamily Protein n=1 Tax=Plasmodium vivax Mauritania I TaxID=1035515 RepID=A0A0J9TKY2_PLAVI|nr:hypothetical protein PVMG_05355 [Plasmodium vivax Mauritania I]